MEKQNNNFLRTDFFLGASTTLGYKSYLSCLREESLKSLVLLKGTQGCGKAKMLDGIAGEATGAVERLHNPQEPTRLIGVVLQSNKESDTVEGSDMAGGVAIVDASMPQSLTPYAPGVREQVVGLYHLVNAETLQPQAAQIETLLAQISCQQTRIARYITSLSGLLLDNRRAVTCVTDLSKVERYAVSLCAKLLPSRHKHGTEKLRFLSAITPEGNLCYLHTIQTLAKRIFIICDEYGAVGKVLLRVVRKEALTRGYDIITCPCALFGEEKIEHILIPSLGLAFVTSNRWHTIEFEGAKKIHASRFTDIAKLKECSARLRFNRKAAKELQAQCSALLAQLKDSNEALRGIYQLSIDKSKKQRILQMMIEEYAGFSEKAGI